MNQYKSKNDKNLYIPLVITCAENSSKYLCIPCLLYKRSSWLWKNDQHIWYKTPECIFSFESYIKAFYSMHNEMFPSRALKTNAFYILVQSAQ